MKRGKPKTKKLMKVKKRKQKTIKRIVKKPIKKAVKKQKLKEVKKQKIKGRITKTKKIRKIKKVVKKPIIRRKTFFKKIKPEQAFHLKGGLKLNNLAELLISLTCMEDKIFNHHVSGHKNDFAKWVEDVFKNNQIAAKLRRIKTKEEMAEVLRDFLIDDFMGEHEELKNKLSELRKRGKDTTIAELKIMPLKSKIEFIKFSDSIQDIKKVTTIFDDVQRELKELEKEVK